jgi:hypothetical protein
VKVNCCRTSRSSDLGWPATTARRLDRAVAENDDADAAEGMKVEPRGPRKLDGLYGCILCACCSLPARAIGGTASASSARPHLQATRWVKDSDEATGERLDDLEDPFRLYRCRTIMVREACPVSIPRRHNRRAEAEDGRAADLISLRRKAASITPTHRSRRRFCSLDRSEQFQTVPDIAALWLCRGTLVPVSCGENS